MDDQEFVVHSSQETSLSQGSSTGINDREAATQRLLRDIAINNDISNFHISNDFTSLATEVKQKRVRAISKLLDVIFEATAPNSGSLLRRLLYESKGPWTQPESEKLNSVLQAVVDAYLNAENSQQKSQALSLIAPFVSYSEIQRYIPGLTYYYYNVAKQLALQHHPGYLETSTARTIVRFSREKIESFVAYITSSLVVQSLPFGTAKVKTSDGKTHFISSVLRTIVNSRIAESYENYLKEIGQESMKISRSSMLRILDYCTAKTRKVMRGVDYFAFEGDEAFSTLMEIARKVSPDSSWQKSVSKRILESMQYLKVDFKIHLKLQSRIADHCESLALSDENNPRFAKICNHDHNLQCPNCAELNSLITEIADKAREWPYPAEDAKLETLYLIDQATVNSKLEKNINCAPYTKREISEKFYSA